MKKVFLSCAALLFAGGVMAQNESKWRELARRDYEPVSYTHLTLPTIYSV